MEEDNLTKVLSLLETAMDLVFLNILWLVCCFPIITIGTSTTAMHYVAQKMVANEDYHIWSDFFKSFRQNWKQGILIELIVTMMALVAIADFWIGTNLLGNVGVICQIIGVIAALLWVAIVGMIFPMLARYQNSLRNLFKNALVIGLMNPQIYIMNIVLIFVWPVLIWVNNDLFMIAIPIMLLLYEAVGAYVVQMLLRSVYKKIEKIQG